MKMPETEGLGTDICFLGARDDESRCDEYVTASASCELAVDVDEIGEIFGFLGFGRVGSFLRRVKHKL